MNENYDIVWTTPSQDSWDSMPLSGASGAGATVWVQDGALWLYLGHSDAFDESGNNLKLGCLRLTPQGVDLGSTSFAQTLRFADNTILITDSGVSVELWFAEQDLMIALSTDAPTSWMLEAGVWRDRVYPRVNADRGYEMSLTPDRVVADRSGIAVSHHNDDHADMRLERAPLHGLTAESLPDFAGHLVSGFAIGVNGGLVAAPAPRPISWQNWTGTAWGATTSTDTTHRVAVALRSEPVDAVGQWRADAARATDVDECARRKEVALSRWRDWWSRSSIVINPGAGEDDPAWLVGRNYQVFRGMLAANQGARIPPMFNGGIFTSDFFPGRITGNASNLDAVSAAGGETTPDFRSWFFCVFMSQNQRWMAWPAVAAGDADLISTYLNYYRDRQGVAAARARGLGAEGNVYPEPMDLWGLCCVDPAPDGLSARPHLRFHFSMMLEAAWIALQARDRLGLDLTEHWEWMTGAVIFYDTYYRAERLRRTGSELDASGRLEIYPANAMETYQGATNPLDVVVGLHHVTRALLSEPALAADVHDRLGGIAERLPEIPLTEREGRTVIAAAESWERVQNPWELPETQALWPWRIAGLAAPGTEDLAAATWDTADPDRLSRQYVDYSWQPTLVNLAALGRTSEAEHAAVKKLANLEAPQARFPAYFGPGHDWVPDHNWGGSGMTGLQEMLLIAEPGDTGALHLFPAWPARWDVDFTLHAPGRTTVSGSLRDGRLVDLEVSPASRTADIVNHLDTAPEKDAA